jgi:hypothetical protein
VSRSIIYPASSLPRWIPSQPSGQPLAGVATRPLSLSPADGVVTLFVAVEIGAVEPGRHEQQIVPGGRDGQLCIVQNVLDGKRAGKQAGLGKRARQVANVGRG